MSIATYISSISAYCAHTERCKSEVSEKLKKSGANSDTIKEIIQLLEKEGFINEMRYAQSFTNDKLRFSKWGRIKIAYALRAKHVDENAIQSAINGIDTDEYLNILHGVLTIKRKSIRDANERDMRLKLIRFGISKGFETDSIRKILNVEEDEYQ